MTCDESSKQAVQSRVEGGGGFDFGSCFYRRSPKTLTLEICGVLMMASTPNQ
jgi:hypothetical protein